MHIDKYVHKFLELLIYVYYIKEERVKIQRLERSYSGEHCKRNSQDFATLEDQQEYHQSTVLQVESKIAKKSISILISPGSTHSYVTPKIVEGCLLYKEKHMKYWLVQLATGKKRKVSEVVRNFPIELNGFFTAADFHVLPLVSYDALIGMDWLEKHRARVDCYNKVL